MGQIFFLLITSAIFARALRKVRRNEFAGCLISAITAAIYLTCLWVPAYLQAAHLIVSKIEKAGLVPVPTPDEISMLSLRWAVELAVVLAAELVSGFYSGRSHRLSPVKRASFGTFGLRSMTILEARRATMFLIVVGGLATVFFPAPSIGERAEGGHGFGVLMRSFLVVGLSMLAYYNFFNRHSFRLIGAAGTAFLIAGSVRSPLLVVLFGYIAGLTAFGKLRPKLMVQLALLAVFLAIVSAFMSNLRGATIRGEQVVAGDIFLRTLESPYVAAYEAGIDTLDGYRLSMLIQPNEPARPLAFLTVITNFVPRALWPDKPTELSVEMSAKYLKYGAGGQFLSPIGYMSIAFGGYKFALLGMFVFIFLLSRLALRFQDSFVLALIVCVTVRFMMGGAAFDFYYGLTLMIPLLVAVIAIRLTGNIRVHRWKMRPGLRGGHQKVM